jgi:hypothetical protein
LLSGYKHSLFLYLCPKNGLERTVLSHTTFQIVLRLVPRLRGTIPMVTGKWFRHKNLLVINVQRNSFKNNGCYIKLLTNRGWYIKLFTNKGVTLNPLHIRRVTWNPLQNGGVTLNPFTKRGCYRKPITKGGCLIQPFAKQVLLLKTPYETGGGVSYNSV